MMNFLRFWFWPSAHDAPGMKIARCIIIACVLLAAAAIGLLAWVTSTGG